MAAYNDVEVYLYQRFVLDISPCPSLHKAWNEVENVLLTYDLWTFEIAFSSLKGIKDDIS